MSIVFYQIPTSLEWQKLGDITYIKGWKRIPKGKKLTEQKPDYPYIRVTDFIPPPKNLDTKK
jgi:hypothetical protein